jgi:hypothetical protein
MEYGRPLALGETAPVLALTPTSATRAVKSNVAVTSQCLGGSEGTQQGTGENCVSGNRFRVWVVRELEK